jgi:hypothetical protein
MWCRRRKEKISWADRVKNKEVLQKESKKTGTYYMQYNKGKLTGFVTSGLETAF